MIKDHFIIIIVVMEERNLERTGVGFERARRKGADDKARGDKSGVSRRRQVITVAHEGPDVAPTKADLETAAKLGERVAICAKRWAAA